MINIRIEIGKCKQLLRFRRMTDVSNLSNDHLAIEVTNTGNGHDNRIKVFHDIC